ncbi:flagellar export chaperone FliS [Pseudomonas sp. S5(2021)]|nr:flagellar export chaperone FliS [Pseudomonas sp. S5(2021)]
MNNLAAIKQYQTVNVQSEVYDASPHRLIQMLVDGGLSRIAQARGALERGQVAAKGMAIGKAVAIMGGLQSALNMDVGGELSRNLDRLYTYISARLVEASATNNVAMMDEASALLAEIKSAWDAIAPTENH